MQLLEDGTQLKANGWKRPMQETIPSTEVLCINYSGLVAAPWLVRSFRWPILEVFYTEGHTFKWVLLEEGHGGLCKARWHLTTVITLLIIVDGHRHHIGYGTKWRFLHTFSTSLFTWTTSSSSELTSSVIFITLKYFCSISFNTAFTPAMSTLVSNSFPSRISGCAASAACVRVLVRSVSSLVASSRARSLSNTSRAWMKTKQSLNCW